MSDFKFWGWDKKPRTMLRFIKLGDIFCFKIDESKYMFGRFISRFDIADIAEIFDYTSNDPIINPEKINTLKRIVPLLQLDSYLLFDRKYEKEGDWRIIGHQTDFIPSDIDNVYFTYGESNSCKKVDVFGNEQSISENEASKLPVLSPHSDYHIKQLLKNI